MLEGLNPDPSRSTKAFYNPRIRTPEANHRFITFLGRYSRKFFKKPVNSDSSDWPCEIVYHPSSRLNL
jgi:hypothetical protein